ncbi:proline-rich receptor-like protein kinase PERK2 [Rosa chinensis]|uniref:proline-rich receptor-like protein kinase PERK2 n=1 Tax=Rosa chinensis TaxID=74649 RepID=UPI000D086BD0|nr:proline-rich receptor-like protein kinase PERK2 [Rosa chinensis]
MASSTDEMPAVGEILFPTSPPSPYPEPSESSGYSLLSSDSSEHSPPPSPSYIDPLAAEIEAEQLNLSPDYSPSPAPYTSPPPYIEVEAPEIYEQAPAPEPSSVFGSGQSADTASGSPDMAPHPTVLPFDYRAEDESAEFEGEDYSSERSKNRITMVGFVIGAICLVALAGFLFNKKKKDNKPRSEDQYELTRREDV